MGWYDRRMRMVRDLPCRGARIFLEIEVRRVLCKACGHMKSDLARLSLTPSFMDARVIAEI